MIDQIALTIIAICAGYVLGSIIGEIIDGIGRGRQ